MTVLAKESWPNAEPAQRSHSTAKRHVIMLLLYEAALKGGSCPCRFDGYRAQALAFSIMRQETCWSNTDRAIVQEWQAGAKGRRRLVAAVEDSLHAPELKEFLEGIDPSEEGARTYQQQGSSDDICTRMPLCRSKSSCQVRFSWQCCQRHHCFLTRLTPRRRCFVEDNQAQTFALNPAVHMVSHACKILLPHDLIFCHHVS